MFDLLWSGTSKPPDKRRRSARRTKRHVSLALHFGFATQARGVSYTRCPFSHKFRQEISRPGSNVSPRDPRCGGGTSQDHLALFRDESGEKEGWPLFAGLLYPAHCTLKAHCDVSAGESDLMNDLTGPGLTPLRSWQHFIQMKKDGQACQFATGLIDPVVGCSAAAGRK